MLSIKANALSEAIITSNSTVPSSIDYHGSQVSVEMKNVWGCAVKIEHLQ